MDALVEGETSDTLIAKEWAYLNTTNFIAYDDRFFDIIGPDAVVEHIEPLAYQSHEAPCYNKKTKQMFFVEWGPPGGVNGTHDWQYLYDVESATLSKIQTDPPTLNAHGCVVYDDSLYVVTDGSGSKETGALVKIDPSTWKKEVILNNYFAQPFLGFNDLDIDSEGNFWLADSKSAYGRGLIDFYYPTNPTVYFVNATTLRPRPVHVTTGNANGVAVALNPDESARDRQKHTVYLPDTGVSEFLPVSKKNPFGNRALFAYDASNSGGVLSNPRLLNNPISYFYDGLRASRSGLLFAGAGDGVDVIDPVDGLALGTIRVGGGENIAVSVTFGEHELWIVGRGGLWRVSNIAERLDREW
jgi:gluconolactonase